MEAFPVPHEEAQRKIEVKRQHAETLSLSSDTALPTAKACKAMATPVSRSAIPPDVYSAVANSVNMGMGIFAGTLQPTGDRGAPQQC